MRTIASTARKGPSLILSMRSRKRCQRHCFSPLYTSITFWLTVHKDHSVTPVEFMKKLTGKERQIAVSGQRILALLIQNQPHPSEYGVTVSEGLTTPRAQVKFTVE